MNGRCPVTLIRTESESCFACLDRRRLYVFDVARQQPLANIPIDEGFNDRLAVSVDKQCCFLGSWEQGIRRMSFAGHVDWTSDIDKSTDFGFIKIFDYVYLASGDLRGTILLDAGSGRKVKVLPGVLRFYGTSSSGISLGHIKKRKRLQLFDRELRVAEEMDYEPFACLAWAASNEFLLVAGADGSLFMYSRIGSEWYNVKASDDQFFNIPALSWNESRQCFFAFATEFCGRKSALISINANLEIEVVNLYMATKSVFSPECSWFLTAMGDYYDFTSGSEGRIRWNTIF